MNTPLRIRFHGVDASTAVEARVREEVDALERLHQEITSCQVTIEVPHKHHRKGVTYAVHIDLTIPGAEIVVGRDPGADHAHEDPYVAIRDAFQAARRRLRKEADRAHGDVKSHGNGPKK